MDVSAADMTSQATVSRPTDEILGRYPRLDVLFNDWADPGPTCTPTYLQTITGPNAGNVVLRMQPDGTLNPNPAPQDSPDPSDSGPSYWLAHTARRGLRRWRGTKPGFAVPPRAP